MSSDTTTTATHFELLGLPKSYSVDAAELERNYLERSRQVHPDFHQDAAGSTQQASMEVSAALNDAYAVLKHPFKRAEYLLELEGGPSASQVKEVPADFLEEMLELRTQIEELRETAARDTPAFESMERQLTERLAAQQAVLAKQFANLPGPGVSTRKNALTAVRQTLNAARFLQNLLRDLRAD